MSDRFADFTRLDPETAQALLRASADSMLDPQVLLEAVRNHDQQVVDFRYLSVNRAACTYLGLQESDLLGRAPS